MNNNKTLKPYLVSAFYKWTMDNNITPLVEVVYDVYNKLPEQIKNQSTVVLNIHPDATRNMQIGKNELSFEAMFLGVDFQVIITYESIQKIFTKEDGYGLEFTVDVEKLKTEYLSMKLNRKIIERKHLRLINSSK
jgi:stringent starvation protein B